MTGAGSPQAWEVLRAQVDALSGPVSPPLDPVKLRYAQALASRLPSAAPAVQHLLQGKLEAALFDLRECVENSAQSAPTDTPERALSVSKSRTEKANAQSEPAGAQSLLGQLNAYLQNVSGHVANGSPVVAAPSRIELKSALRFRETWALISAETEVEKATHRAPENAGPLNAHNLVLRTLALMRELSPDYLRRFMAHTESLLALDQAYGRLKQPVAKEKAARAAKKPKV